MKIVLWIASSKKDLLEFAPEVARTFGYALYQAQQGSLPDIGKPLKGFGSADVVEQASQPQSRSFRAELGDGKFPEIRSVEESPSLKEGVLQLIENTTGGTFRAVYTVRFVDAIIVLHVFQKKSKKGIETPKPEIDLILARLKRAEEVYREWKIKGK